MIQGFRRKEFNNNYFNNCSEANLEKAIADTIPPKRFVSTTNFPTYVKYNKEWHLVNDARMDACLVYDEKTKIFKALEMRKIRKELLVVINKSDFGKEDGSEGIYVDQHPFDPNYVNCNKCGSEVDISVLLSHEDKECSGYCTKCNTKISGESGFKFMSNDVSREQEIDYDEIAQKIHEQRENNGHQIWVLGPAIVHAGAIKDMSWLVDHGYVNALFGGNAIGVHDIETALFGTALGKLKKGQDKVEGDHSSHIRAIHAVKENGSIEQIVERGILTSGVIYSCVKNKVPFVLAGSIRDDGPLPETITDALEAQDIMREHTKKATSAIMLATALHSIATGNMLPTFYVRNELLYPLMTVCVDQSEFVVSKLKDRGTHQVYGAITNAQDFIHRIRLLLESYK